MAESVLYPGDKSKDVVKAKKLIKRHLIALGFKGLAKNITSDATYGPVAVEGVKKIQKHYGLEQDGAIGPKTWAALKSATKKSPKPLKIYSREFWGAGSPKSRSHCDWGPYTTTWLHHTDTAPPEKGLKGSELLAAEKRCMQTLQDIGFSRGFADISYSYIIFPSGHVYEGRGFEVVGAHTLGHNEDVGVSLVGDYMKMHVTAEQKEALSRLRKKLAVSRGHLRGHFESFPTDCPGKNAIEAFGLGK